MSIKKSYKNSHGFFNIILIVVLISIGVGMLNTCRNKVGVKRTEQMDQLQVGAKIDLIFTDFVNERFIEKEDVVVPASGWIMTLPSGRNVPRSFLQEQAMPVIKQGSRAVPHLFKWVKIKNLPVRYIAIYSLDQITGIETYVPHFDKEDSHGYIEKAIKQWQKWWEQNKDKFRTEENKDNQ